MTLPLSGEKRNRIETLEHRMDEIEHDLNALSHFTPRGGVGAVGYRSAELESAESVSWVKIQLPSLIEVDEVVLVPCIIRDATYGLRADGFPKRVKIYNEKGKLLAQSASEEVSPLRVAPLKLALGGEKASEIMVEAHGTHERIFDGKPLLQFSEILVFSQRENVAIKCPVEGSHPPVNTGTAWSPQNLTDGELPYLMNSAQGKRSIAYLSPPLPKEEHEISLTFDLENVHSVRKITLHAVDQSDTIPQQAFSGVGMPPRVLIEGALKKDFSDAEVLARYSRTPTVDLAPILSLQLLPAQIRYLRIRALREENNPLHTDQELRLGFAEVELITNGVNILKNKKASLSPSLKHATRSLDHLTDGANFYGKVLTEKDWIDELILRYELEQELPSLKRKLRTQYAAQKRRHQALLSTGGFLLFSTLLGMTWYRHQQRKKLQLLKERFAADLHDEIGAKVHSVRLLLSLAQKEPKSSPALPNILETMSGVVQRLGLSVNHATNLLDAEGIMNDLPADLHRVSSRLMMPYEIKIEGEELLNSLHDQLKLDLLLFYRECLTNINRHAEAESLQVKLTLNQLTLCLEVIDDGVGLKTSEIPRSLKRRARLMEAQVSIIPSKSGGTGIKLMKRLKKKHFQ